MAASLLLSWLIIFVVFIATKSGLWAVLFVLFGLFLVPMLISAGAVILGDERASKVKVFTQNIVDSAFTAVKMTIFLA